MVARILSVTMVAGLVLLVTSADAADPTQKCEAGKLKEAAKYLSCRLKADAKSVTTLVAPNYTNCDQKLTTKFPSLETKAANAGGSCPTVDDVDEEHTALRADAAATAWRLSADPRFIDNGDGTVTDRATNLMWEKKVSWDHTANYAERHDTDNTYAFSGECSVSSAPCQPTADAAARCSTNIEPSAPGSSYCDQCPGAETCAVGGTTIWTWLDEVNDVEGFAGHNDWRVPTRVELLSLVYDANADPSVDDVLRHNCYLSFFPPCSDISSTACSCTPSTFVEAGEARYFTATTTAIYNPGAWAIDFTEGQANGINLSGTPLLLVRAVRSAS